MTSPPQLGYTAPMPVLMMHSGGAATQQPIAKLAAGVANALLRLIENWSVLATVAPPPVLDERVDPLLAHPDAGLVAFLWGEGAALGLRMPHSSVLSAFITTMALQLEMRPSQLVVAYTTIEIAAQRHRELVQRHTVRPLILCAMVTATQIAYDAKLTLTACVARLKEDLPGLTCAVLREQQAQLADLIQWRFPIRPAVFHAYSQALANEASARLGIFVPAPLLPHLW